MSWEKMDTLCIVDSVQQKISKPTPSQGITPTALMNEEACSLLSLPVLAAHCVREIDNFRRGEPYTERYGLELLHRAIIQGDQEAWAWMQHCFGGMVHDWVRRHPQSAKACRLESEENYVAQAFERFWQAIARNQQLEFRTLAFALQYLRTSVHGAIIDTLRTYQRPKEVSLPESGAVEEPSMNDVTGDSELWDTLKGLFSNPREQRLAYLLFHCGLKPREIVQFCSPEWSSVQEIYRLRRTIMERILRHVDFLRWRLT
jgi:DNA-directed RNA polymerase specialized sigma24 family protein